MGGQPASGAGSSGNARNRRKARQKRRVRPEALYNELRFPVSQTLTVRYSKRSGVITDLATGKVLVTLGREERPDARCLIEALRTLRWATPHLEAAGFSDGRLHVQPTRDGFRLRLSAKLRGQRVEFPSVPAQSQRGELCGTTEDQWRSTVNLLTRQAVASTEASATPGDKTRAYAEAFLAWNESMA